MKSKGWDVNPPADPPGSRFGRNPDGSLDGRGFELPVLMVVAGDIIGQARQPTGGRRRVLRDHVASQLHLHVGHDLRTEHEGGLRGLGGRRLLPVADQHVRGVDQRHLRRSGQLRRGRDLAGQAGRQALDRRLPWVGNIGISFPYLDNDTTRMAGIDAATAGGAHSMNYTRPELDAILDKAAPGWQMAFHSTAIWPSASPWTPTRPHWFVTTWPARTTAGAWSTSGPVGGGTSTGPPSSASTPRWRPSSITTGAICWTARCSTTSTAHPGSRSPTRPPRGGGVVPQRRFGIAALAHPQHRHGGHPTHPFRGGTRSGADHAPASGAAGAHHRRRPHPAP